MLDTCSRFQHRAPASLVRLCTISTVCAVGCRLTPVCLAQAWTVWQPRNVQRQELLKVGNAETAGEVPACAAWSVPYTVCPLLLQPSAQSSALMPAMTPAPQGGWLTTLQQQQQQQQQQAGAGMEASSAASGASAWTPPPTQVWPGASVQHHCCHHHDALLSVQHLLIPNSHVWQLSRIHVLRVTGPACLVSLH
jgi:hypothetical protein